MYRVKADDTKQEITTNHVTALDEHVLLAAGISAGAAMTESGTQTDGDEQMLPLKTLEKKKEKDASKKAETVTYKTEADLPIVGDKIEIMWGDAKGETWRWHEGTVVETSKRNKTPSDEGTLHHIVYTGEQWKIDGEEIEYIHDLATEHALGKHPWKMAKKKQSKEKTMIAPSKKKGGPMTRRDVETSKTLMMIEKMVDEAEKPVDAFNKLIYAAYGELGEKYEAANGRDMELSLRALKAMAARGDEPTQGNIAAAAKKKKNVTEVRTELGDLVDVEVPTGTKGVMASMYREEWLRASRSALHDSIVALPGNTLVPEDVANEEMKRHNEETGDQEAMIDMTTTRTVKTCKATKKLIKFKVRHSVDEAKIRRTAKHKRSKKTEQLDQQSVYTVPSGDMEFKAMMSTVDKANGDHVDALDFPDAYGLGDTERGPRFLRIPEEIAEYDEMGRRMCVRLVTSLWGEGAAGFEWETTRDEMLKACGWERVPGVISMYHHGTARAIINIDDMLVITRNNTRFILDETLNKLNEMVKAKGGRTMTKELDVTTWGGLHIKYSADDATITLLLTVHIEKSAAKWLPEMVKTGEWPKDLPKGRALQKLLDGLRLAPTENFVLTTEAREFMSIVGDLRWMTRVLLRILRHCWRLSCVAARPPPEGKKAALGVLALAYMSKNEGITYGGTTAADVFTGMLKRSVDSKRGAAIAKVDPERLTKGTASKGLEGHVDTTWSIREEGHKKGDGFEYDDDAQMMDVYALALTNNGGAILHEMKKIGVVLEDGNGMTKEIGRVTGASTIAEGFGLARLGDKIDTARQLVEAATGHVLPPTMVLSDNEGSLRIASGEVSATRAKHALRWWAAVTQRMRERKIKLAHCPDAAMAVDFFTKWVGSDKAEHSIALLSGAHQRAAHES